MTTAILVQTFIAFSLFVSSIFLENIAKKKSNQFLDSLSIALSGVSAGMFIGVSVSLLLN